FIRAPWIEEHGPEVEVMAWVDEHPVAVRQGNVVLCAFHPELTDDSRVEALARILVRYSTEVREGETCVIEGSTAGEPLIAAVYEEVLAAGGLPVMSISVQGQLPIFFEHCSDAQ